MTTVTHPVSLVGPRVGGYVPRGQHQRPVAALADRLRALRPELPFLYGIDLLPPDVLNSDDWFRPADVLDPMFARMFARNGEHLRLSPAVAAARIVTSLAYATLGRAAVGLVLARRAPDVGPDSLLLRLDAGGLVEQTAVTDPAVAMLPHDPMSSSADARVLPGESELVDRVADQLVATLQPLIEDLHRRTRFGVVPMWNLTSDSCLGPSAAVPLPAGFEQESGRRVATALVGALVERGAPILRRG